ncbi:GlgB N-terminal domain-containing protein, partial [Kaarinaea lacus]
MTRATSKKPELSADLVRLSEARHHDPFNVLGRHTTGQQAVIRVYSPHTQSLFLADIDEPLDRVGESDFFEWHGTAGKVEGNYQLSRKDSHGQTSLFYDPYSFPPQVPDFDLDLFSAGRHLHCYRFLGSNIKSVDGVKGV